MMRVASSLRQSVSIRLNPQCQQDQERVLIGVKTAASVLRPSLGLLVSQLTIIPPPSSFLPSFPPPCPSYATSLFPIPSLRSCFVYPRHLPFITSSTIKHQ